LLVIKNESQLRRSYELVSKFYALRDRIAAEPSGDHETRLEEAQGVEAVIRKIERQIQTYLTEKASAAPSAA
jgi:hypothetical protein